MTMAKRARAAARANPSDRLARDLGLVVGVGLAVAATSAGLWPLAGVGGLLVGLAFRPEAERYYLEGFTDGILAAELESPAPARDARPDPRDVGPLPTDAGEPARQPHGADRDAPRPPSRRFSPVGAREPEPRLADAVGLRVGAGPFDVAFGADGAPLIAPFELGVVPAARASGSPGPDLAAGAEAGPEAHRRQRPSSLSSAMRGQR